MYQANKIANILECDTRLVYPVNQISYLATDSRRISFAAETLFFALQTANRDGHAFIAECYDRGLRNFVVHTTFDYLNFSDANFFIVKDTLAALQKLAKHHRQCFHYPVIAITGSNGKTIVKEWLYQLLSDSFAIVRTPRSYNSQIGVPLSVWEMNNEYNLAIFEAGISEKNEMYALENIIQPDIGIFTNLGEAHSNGFANDEEKIDEKWKLFSKTKMLFTFTDNQLIQTKIAAQQNTSVFSIAHNKPATIEITHIAQDADTSELSLIYKGQNAKIVIPFTDAASIENCCLCIAVCLFYNMPVPKLQQNLLSLQPIEMRLQVLPGTNGSTFINDSYSLDLQSLSIALEFLSAQPQRKSLILSDFPEKQTNTYEKAIQLLAAMQLHLIVFIGDEWYILQKKISHILPQARFYRTTAAFLTQYNSIQFSQQTILIKGARKYNFENLISSFQQKTHNTYLEIDLNALEHNLKTFRQQLQPTTRIMAMVKAFGYGSGSLEIASLLQFHKVDYLTVAYTDEAVDLKEAGISLPVAIMNIDAYAFEKITTYRLEPVIFSFGILNSFIAYLEKEGLHQYPVHIKLDTGMHRLGFSNTDVPKLSAILKNNSFLHVKSVFSHLASSGEKKDNHFTQQQATDLQESCALLTKELGYTFLQHINNSAGIMMHPELQMDMVRLGIGLYGLTAHNGELMPVISLKTTIAQIRKVSAGETIGYNRQGKLARDAKIATIRIGYADGFKRIMSNGVGKVYVKNKLAPVIGLVCMDMTMIDITDIEDVAEEDEVELFGAHLPIQWVANWCGTNVYEILTGIGQRVKRIYSRE